MKWVRMYVYISHMEDSLLFNRVLFVFLTTSTTRHIITNMYITFNQTEKEKLSLFNLNVCWLWRPSKERSRQTGDEFVFFFLNNNKKKNWLCQSYR